MIDKQELLEKSISELRDISYSLKLNVTTLELENRYLKQSIDEIKKTIEKEAERREQEAIRQKNSLGTVKAAMITGGLGFLTSIIVAIISLFKH